MAQTSKIKVHEEMASTTPMLGSITYHEKTYLVREICDDTDTYTVSVEDLEVELLDGLRALDYEAADIVEIITFFFTKEQIQTLTNEELIEIMNG